MPPASDDEVLGEALVRRARATLDASVRGRSIGELEAELRREELPEAFRAPRGVFVTLKHHPSGDLRGCIGYPLPVLPLPRALLRATVAASREDPRFPPVRPGELDRLVVEVSALTVPEPLPGPPERRASEVVVGRHGLVVEEGGEQGLLLPQVAPEQGWSAREFLEGTCEKAGLDRDAWRRPSATVLRFTARVFAERTPRGAVERIAEVP